MEAQTYRCRNLREALELIRRELGPEAALLHTRRVRRAGLQGWLTGATELEITASADANLPSRLLADDLLTDTAEEEFGTSFESQSAASQALLESDGFGETHPTPSNGDSAWYPLSQIAPQSVSLHQQATERLGSLQFSGPLGWRPGRSHWVALIGPTGVGKTTTLAKLAAEYRLDRRLEVCLVTLDTYRVNGAAHLRTYADILNLPLEVVDSPERMQQLAEELTDRFDVVLLDTGGQGPRDDEQRRRLRAMLEAARPDEIHLTLSATGSGAVFRDAVRRFSEFRPTSLTLTKLDEAPAEACLVEEVLATELPLSYLTFGQQVPQDIALADTESAAAWLLPVDGASPVSRSITQRMQREGV